MQTTSVKGITDIPEVNITLINMHYAPFDHTTDLEEGHTIEEAELIWRFIQTWGKFGLEKTSFEVDKFTLTLTRDAIAAHPDPTALYECEPETITIELSDWKMNIDEVDEPYFGDIVLDFENKYVNFE